MTALRRVVALYASPQFGRFLLVGGTAALVQWLSRFGFNRFMDYGWALVLAYVLALATGYLLNKLYVFPYSTRPMNLEIFLFIVVNVAAFPFVWGIAYVLGEWVLPHWLEGGASLALGHAAALGVPVIFSFAFHKFLTFRDA